MVGLGVLLNLLVWRKRKFARILTYYELTSNLIQTFCPFAYGDLMMMTLFLSIEHAFFVAASRPAFDVLLCVITVFLQTAIIVPINYKAGHSMKDIQNGIFNVVFAGAVLAFISMAITYIAQLKGRITKLMVENTNLLNRINEGLIVLPQDGVHPTFTNNSAMRIFARSAQSSDLQDLEDGKAGS